MFTRRSADEELRHCLTVVSGYLGLILEERPEPMAEDHWLWLERAQRAAARAVALCDVEGALRDREPDAQVPAAGGVTHR